MDTKPLLYGLIGFFIGGFIVALAATTLNRPTADTSDSSMSSMSMDDMTQNLKEMSGDDYDQAFIEMMIAHHEGAVEMAQLSSDRANHDEIKQLSADIITAQEQEIRQMKQWHADWGYGDQSMERMDH